VTRTEQGDATKARVVEVATRLFAEQGFQDVAIPDILEAAGVSRGALYHHFESKEALFEIVLEAAEERLAVELLAASAGRADPVDSLRAGCETFIRLAREPVIRQVLLADALAVVGWAKWREIDNRYGFGLMKAAVQAISPQADIPPAAVDAVAHMLLASVMELALLVAESDEKDAVQRATAALELMLRRLLEPPGKKRG